MIFKILFFVLAIFLIFLLFFKKSRKDTIDNSRKDESKEELMIECKSCNTFVSKQDAILSNGQYFCSKECLK